MEEKSKCRHCYNCGYYSPYYTKGNIKFNKTEVGWCRAKLLMVNRHDFCDRFMSARYRFKNFSKSSTVKALHAILSQLGEIKQIIEEAQADE